MKVATRLLSTAGACPTPTKTPGTMIANILDMKDMCSRSQLPRKFARISQEPQKSLTALITGKSQ